MKVGDVVKVVSGNPEDDTFDMRFADKFGTIFEERTEEGDITFSVAFNPNDFDPDVEPGANIIEDKEHWLDRLQKIPFTESFWPEELIPIVRVKVQSSKRDIHIDCPHCDMWEQLGIDDPRHRLNMIPIIEWYPDEKGKNEVSLHQCTQCNNKFEVEWDYDNPIV